MTIIFPIVEEDKIEMNSGTIPEKEDKQDLITHCLSDPTVDMFLSRAITSVLLTSEDRSQIFQELENRSSYYKSRIHSKAEKGLEIFCVSLFKSIEDLQVENTNVAADLSILSEFYQTLGYSYFMNLLYRYGLSVDNMHIEKQQELSSLFTQSNKKENTCLQLPTEKKNISGSILAGSRKIKYINWINQEIAPRFWGKELLQFYFKGSEEYRIRKSSAEPSE